MAEQALEAQLRTIERMALQHFPESESQRLAYENGLLRQRLREYHYRFTALPVKDMNPEAAAGLPL